jgi:3-phosphoshikimate 1-carboxyvinyltransferase
MDIRIKPQMLQGKVEAVAAKADGHRILIAAALADRPTKIKINTWSEDLEATLDVLTRMGMRSHWEDKNVLMVYPIEEMPCTRTVDCNNSGSTLRFLFPLAAALGCNSFTYTGTKRLSERPMEPLIDAMKGHGVLIEGEKLPLRVSGQLHGGTYHLPGNISSQYISGLLFALPLLIADSRLILTSEPESNAYIDMTIDTLKKFGVIIKRDGRIFDIKGRQNYISPGEINVEKDWSNTAFWLVAGAIGKEITVEGVSSDSLQSDRAIVPLIKKMFGEEVEEPMKGITIRKKALTAIDIDASQIPDLVPILAVLACAAQGTTTIYNAERLRIKESDRLKTITENLSILGADIKETKDGLKIRGGKALHGGVVQGYNDHRIVMACAIASLLTKEEITIEGAEAVNKSYPGFFADFKTLGGKIDVL